MLHDLGLDPGDGSRILCGGALQAVGGGHDLLRAVGASFSPLERVWRYPFGAVDHRDLSGERGIAVRGIEDGEVWVNAQGQRFHDESRRGGATGTPALLAQRPATCWAIFDRAHACRLTLADPYYRRGDTPCRERIEWFLRTSPFVWSGESFGSLAGAIGLPVERFVETMERFGAWLRDGVAVDPDFGRDLTAVHRADEPPYYAVQFFPMARKALGGVNTDLDCRVLDVGGGPIPGLYAAGEVAGMAGGHLNGTAALEGTMIGPSLLAGRIASQAIVSAVRGPRAGRTPATRLTVPSPDGFGGHRV
jgi:succinate dehydrogenase/fumarate reductase flavoprotein subunit